MIKETTLVINLSDLTHNFKVLKSKIKSETKLLAVVKANAYGSDSVVIAKKLQELNIDYFAVAYTSEGEILRNAGIVKPIIVLHPQPKNFKTIIDRCLEPNIYSFRVYDEFQKTAKKLKQENYPIHIKVNSGLNRLGFSFDEIEKLSEKIKNESSLKVLSLFSHLAATEDLTEDDFTKRQIEYFIKTANKFDELSNSKPFRHVLNTSGIFNYPEAQFNMVRSGIGFYGFANDINFDKELIPIASLKSVISQIHHIKKGDTVGYNRAFKANNITKTATIPIGHADGITRIFGKENGFVFINNHKAHIIGNVCMDMIMVDISNIECKEEDEVIVFDKYHKANTLAENANTISYELITDVAQRVNRLIIH